MQRFYFLLLLSALSIHLAAQNNPFIIGFERDSNTTATYFETIAFYEKLAKAYPKQLKLVSQGMTDAGYPLHVAILSKDGDFDPASIRKKGKRILFVNNAIHPGEPCGVDATMMLLRNYLQQKNPLSELNNLVIVTIPFYNIGGGLNRGSYSRANQNGPAAYGFRGNAKNLDLNRDFIKCDSKNAQTFNQIYATWQPDIFIDNHISDGADYTYTMTLIAGQKDKLDPNLAAFMEEKLLPAMYAGMKKSGWEMTPYVNSFGEGDPTKGIVEYFDLPRLGSGYAALHNALPFIAETHMLKAYKDQVQSTYALMRVLVQFINQNAQAIADARNKAIENTRTKKMFDLNWQLDRTKRDSLLFKGYEAKQKPSEISGLDRLYYDRSMPYEKYIPFYHTYNANITVEKPIAYIIPQAYTEIIDRLKWNGVQLQRLQQDTDIALEMYYIQDYKSGNRPYEGHYVHNNVVLDTEMMTRTYHKGDYVVYVNQPANRYIVETLEPQGVDSYFAWNFFDAILQQKEGYSDYVFEDSAAEYLKQHPDLQKQLEEKRAADSEFAKSADAQLDFIYKNSPYYEKTHNLYPVGRLVKATELPVK